ncbi:MAG: DUF4082 domain-containing protein, partial [Actinomycetota bacterium]|nr:DUF4082 domain-containing protein [Actinomycetota bacterium]
MPSSIPADGSRAVENEIMQFLAQVPDGATVQFPEDGIYGQNSTITVADRTDLDIDGNGSTFKKLTPTDPDKLNNANWRIAGGDGVTLRNMIIRGSFQPPPRGTMGQGFPSDHGVSIWGALNLEVRNIQAFNIAGDFLACDPDVRFGPNYAVDPPCRNVLVDNFHGEHAGRHGFTATHADGFTLQNSSALDVQNEGVDLEIDVDGELLRNIQLLNNQFSDTFGPAIWIPRGSSPNVENITISGNTVLRAGDLCWPAIDVGGSTRNIFVRDNHLLTKGDGIRLTNVSSGEVSGNRLENVLFGAPCGFSSNHVPIRLVNSSVTESDNASTGFCPCSFFGQSASPSQADLGGPGEVGVRFQSDVAGSITGIRFYKPEGASGTHVANLWGDDGSLLASATFTAEQASGWQRVDFPSAVFVRPSTMYTASYHSASGIVASTPESFATSGLDVPPLHA